MNNGRNIMNKRRRRRLHAVLFTFLFGVATAASAHDVGQSHIFLTMNGNEITIRVEMNVPDTNLGLGLALAEDFSVVDADLKPHQPALVRYVREHLTLAPDGVPAALTPGGVTVFNTSFVQFVQVHFTLMVEERPSFMDVEYTVLFDVIPDHVGYLVIENNWLTHTFDNEAEIALTFTAGKTESSLDLSSSSVLTGMLGMIEMGMHHIWIGIDHVLFLMALLLPSVMQRKDRHWQPVPDLKTALIQVVKIVTAFTIAHTITLSLATLELVTLPSRLVESIIAVSIAVVALDIIFPMFRNWTYSVVLAFGLFHGFGFASVLAEMPIPSSYMALSLLGFNIGVEVGQLAIVCVAVPVLFALRNWWFYPRVSMPAGAALLIIISLYWFVERAFEVDLPAGALLNYVIGLV